MSVGDTVFAREITVGGGLAVGYIVAEHFGLGRHVSAKVRVNWPGQGWSDWSEINAGKPVLLTRQATSGLAVSDY